MLIVAVSIVLAQATASPPSLKFPVHVKTAQAAGGFTDPSKDRRDSVKDLLKRLKDSKVLRVVDSEDAALIVIEVLGRETRREVNFWGFQNKSYLTVRMTVGEFSTEFSGESGSKGVLKGYGDASGKVLKQINAWVEENRPKLEAMVAEAATVEESPSPTPKAVMPSPDSAIPPSVPPNN